MGHHFMKHLVTAPAVGVVSVLATLLVSTPADAAVVDQCNFGGAAGLCTYWGQSYNGAQVEIVSDRADLASPVVYYPANGTGQGEHVYNNNGSERNGNGLCPVTIYYNANYSSYSVTMAPYGQPGYQKAGSQLGSLLNNIRSLRFNCN
jgi:hypothetical protein